MVALIIFIQLLILFIIIRIASCSRFNGMFIGIVWVSHMLLYVFPFIFNFNNYEDLSWLILFSSLGMLYGLFIILIFYKKGKFNIIQENFKKNLYKLNSLSKSKLLLLSYVFIGISIFSIYKSLQTIGGALVMLSATGGGREYLEARVNGENSGTLGLLIWLAPIAISYIYLNFLIETRKKIRIRKVIIFLTLLIIISVGYMLLTVRHNMIATFLMLFLIFTFVKGFSKSKFIVIALFGIIVIYAFQAIRIGGVDELTFEGLSENKSKETEHLEVTKEIYNKVNINGFTKLDHINDVFIFLIPRSIWQEKPKTSMLNRTYFPVEASVGSEKAIGIIGEGFSMWGISGVFLLVFLFTSFIGFIQYKIDKLEMNLFFILFVLVMVPLTYIGIRTGVFGKHLLSSIIMIIQVYMYKYLYKLTAK